MNRTGITAIALSLVVATSIGSTAFAGGWGTSQGSNTQWQDDGRYGQQYGQTGDSNGQCWGQDGGYGQVGRNGNGNDQRGSWCDRRSNRASGYEGWRGGAGGCERSDRFGRNRQADQGWGDRRGCSGWKSQRRSTHRWNGNRQGQDIRDGGWDDSANYGR